MKKTLENIKKYEKNTKKHKTTLKNIKNMKKHDET